MAEWRETTLAGACERIDYGLTTTAVSDGSGPRFLRITDIDGSHVTWDTVPRCAADTQQTARYQLADGDIVIARTGASTGRSQWIETVERSVFASYLVRFRTSKDYDSRFVAYMLQTGSWLEHVNSIAHGKSAQPNMSARDMGAFEFSAPSPGEQRAIAEVLGALDDKIAANTHLQGLTWDLASSKFRLLRQQRGEALQFADFLDLNYGKSLPASRREPGPVAVYGSGGIVGSHSVALSARGAIVGRKGTAGSVMWSHRPFFAIDTTYYVTPKGDRATDIFCYFALRGAGLESLNSDSAVPGLNRQEALAQRTFVPTRTAIDAYSDEVMRLLEIDDAMTSESEALARTRDALLPALMSGKLRIKDAERVVSDAV